MGDYYVRIRNKYYSNHYLTIDRDTESDGRPVIAVTPSEMCSLDDNAMIWNIISVDGKYFKLENKYFDHRQVSLVLYPVDNEVEVADASKPDSMETYIASAFLWMKEQVDESSYFRLVNKYSDTCRLQLNVINEGINPVVLGSRLDAIDNNSHPDKFLWTMEYVNNDEATLEQS